LKIKEYYDEGGQALRMSAARAASRKSLAYRLPKSMG
jgi:hypothetical protein